MSAIATLAEVLEEKDTQDVPKGLPQRSLSICPECRKKIWAEISEKEGKVVMEKTCPEHGFFDEVLNTDPYLFLKAERWTFQDGIGIENPQVTNARQCPEDCGLCQMHFSTAAQVNIDLTNRCNFRCPICFAHAEARGFLYEPTLSQVREMLTVAYNTRPQRLNGVQFSGGEPTIAETFLPACSFAKELGYKVVQVATNGQKFTDLDFCFATKRAGLNGLYLQFDGLDDEVYLKTRGRPLVDLKKKVLQNCRQAGLWVVFVPTVVMGVNNQEVGKIFEWAIENVDIMQGIAYQPISFTGRVDYEERRRMRYTIGDLAWDLERQTGIISARDDFYPLSVLNPLTDFFSLTAPKKGKGYLHLTNHAHCSQGTYILVDRETGRAAAITRLFDFEEAIMDFHRLNKRLALALGNGRYSAKGLREGFQIVKRHFNEQNPLGIGFWPFLKALLGVMGRGRQSYYHGRLKFLLIGGMHFQDLYNFEVERVKRCVIHYMAPDPDRDDGRGVKAYPFCAYNSGPLFRDKVEAKFGKPYKAKVETEA